MQRLNTNYTQKVPNSPRIKPETLWCEVTTSVTVQEQDFLLAHQYREA